MKPFKSPKRDLSPPPKNTRELIRQVALAQLAECGYEKLTIRRICRAAAVSVGTFYNNYTGKQEILLELYNEIDDALKKIPGDLLLPFKEEVLTYLRTKADTVAKFHETYGFPQVFLALQQSESDSLKLEERDIYYHVFNATLRGQYKGEVRNDLEAQDIARRILRCLLGQFLDWTLHDCDYDIVEMIDREFRLYLDVFMVEAPVRDTSAAGLVKR